MTEQQGHTEQPGQSRRGPSERAIADMERDKAKKKADLALENEMQERVEKDEFPYKIQPVSPHLSIENQEVKAKVIASWKKTFSGDKDKDLDIRFFECVWESAPNWYMAYMVVRNRDRPTASDEDVAIKAVALARRYQSLSLMGNKLRMRPEAIAFQKRKDIARTLKIKEDDIDCFPIKRETAADSGERKIGLDDDDSQADKDHYGNDKKGSDDASSGTIHVPINKWSHDSTEVDARVRKAILWLEDTYQWELMELHCQSSTF